jgi:hypothetical protein
MMDDKDRLATRDRIFTEIRLERDWQDAKHGGWKHDKGNTASDWIRILNQHTAKAKEAAMQSNLDRYRKHLIEVAAIAVAQLEVLDELELYNKSKWEMH